jgi:uncharacterized membrane protein
MSETKDSNLNTKLAHTKSKIEVTLWLSTFAVIVTAIGACLYAMRSVYSGYSGPISQLYPPTLSVLLVTVVAFAAHLAIRLLLEKAFSQLHDILTSR